MSFSFNLYKKIYDLFRENEILGTTEISNKLLISRVSVYKVINKLVEEKKIQKTGKASHVRYKSLIFEVNKNSKDNNIVDYKTKIFLDNNFFKFDSDGKILEGFYGFEKWNKDRLFDFEKSINNYKKIINYVSSLEDKCGLLDATEIFNNKFEKNYMSTIYYSSEYSFMEFGRSKLAEKTFYAKQSQNIKLINDSIDEIFYKIQCLVKVHKIDCIGIIPWSISRKNQLLFFLKKKLDVLNIDYLKIIKYYSNNIPIPQKSIKTKEGRIKNATNTIFIRDDNISKYSNILLIDDFVGSGSTLNITAQKIINEGGKNIIGFAFVGSLDLKYEIINEI